MRARRLRPVACRLCLGFIADVSHAGRIAGRRVQFGRRLGSRTSRLCGNHVRIVLLSTPQMHQPPLSSSKRPLSTCYLSSPTMSCRNASSSPARATSRRRARSRRIFWRTWATPLWSLQSLLPRARHFVHICRGRATRRLARKRCCFGDSRGRALVTATMSESPSAVTLVHLPCLQSTLALGSGCCSRGAWQL